MSQPLRLKAKDTAQIWHCAVGWWQEGSGSSTGQSAKALCGPAETQWATCSDGGTPSILQTTNCQRGTPFQGINLTFPYRSSPSGWQYLSSTNTQVFLLRREGKFLLSASSHLVNSSLDRVSWTKVSDREGDGNLGHCETPLMLCNFPLIFCEVDTNTTLSPWRWVIIIQRGLQHTGSKFRSYVALPEKFICLQSVSWLHTTGNK